jgi:hypothetical protein
MNCLDFERFLNEEFEPSGLAESAELVEHARHCADCRPMWERCLVLSESIALWREETPEVDLTEAVVSACVPCTGTPPSPDGNIRVVVPAVTPTHSSFRLDDVLPLPGNVARSPLLLFRLGWRRGALAVAVLGLAVLLVISAMFLGRQNDQGETNNVRLVETSPVERVEETAPAVRPEMDPDLENPQVVGRAPTGDAYYDLARKAAGALSMATVSLIPGAPPHTPSSEPRPESADGWIDGLQHQLRPIGQSVGDAFDFLWQAGQSADG